MCAKKVNKLRVPEVPDLNAQIEFLNGIRAIINQNNTFPVTIVNTDVVDAIIQTLLSHRINLYVDQLEQMRNPSSQFPRSVITDPEGKTIL